MGWTETELQEDILVDELLVEENELVLINDDVNTFEHVINCLIDYCKHDTIQAEQCAYIVHYHGSCSVKKGEFKKLVAIKQALQEKGLTVEIN